jgi:hypothetical protein
MKTLPKVAIGCLIAVVVFIVSIIAVGFGALTVLKSIFSNVSFTTGPPPSPPTIADGYSVKADGVYYTRNDNFFGNWVPKQTKLAVADSKTFEVMLDAYWAKDATHVYHEGDVLSGADPRTFKVFDGSYAGDAGHIYWRGAVIPGAKGYDPSVPFEVLNGNSTRARDKHHVYSSGNVIEGADPASFQLIGQGHIARDKNDYYAVNFEDNLGGQYPLHMNLATFKLLIPAEPTGMNNDPWDNLWDQLWAHDDTKYVVGGKTYPIADPATFEVLRYGYAKDSKAAYFLDKVIAGADPQTFQIVSPDHAANWAWSFGRYAKDANHVYYKENVIPDADAATFVVVDEREFKDKNHTYREGRVVEE